jgi:hypothetical protein
VERETSYRWGEFSFPKLRADIRVWQGSALSPVESALYSALVLAIFNQYAAHLKATVLLYMDDGSLIFQSKSWETNLCVLKEAYSIMFNLLTEFGLILEHDKSKLFHFSRTPGNLNPLLDLGYQPYTNSNPLKLKTYWRYLGFYFDHVLNFKEYM